METKSAFVGTYRAVELHAVAFVYAHSALVVHPRHSEHQHAFGFDETFEKTRSFVDGVVVNDDFEAFKHFGDRLMEFGFAGIVFLHLSEHSFCIRSHIYLRCVYSYRTTAGC